MEYRGPIKQGMAFEVFGEVRLVDEYRPGYVSLAAEIWDEEDFRNNAEPLVIDMGETGSVQVLLGGELYTLGMDAVGPDHGAMVLILHTEDGPMSVVRDAIWRLRDK